MPPPPPPPPPPPRPPKKASSTQRASLTKKSSPKRGCKKDSDCTEHPDKPFCNVSSGRCINGETRRKEIAKDAMGAKLKPHKSPPKEKGAGGIKLPSDPMAMLRKKNQQPKEDSFVIRNFQCVPDRGGPYKTLEDCDNVLISQKATDAFITVLRTIDKDYYNALNKFEKEQNTIARLGLELEKERNKETQEIIANKIANAEKAALIQGERAQNMENEFVSTLPKAPEEIKKLYDAVRAQKGQIDSFAEFATVYQNALGRSFPATARLQALIDGQKMSQVKVSAPKLAKSAPKVASIATAPKARSAAKPADHLPQQPFVINLYNNIAAMAPTNQERSMYVLNKPRHVPLGQKVQLDSYILGKDGKYYALFMGPHGALYILKKNKFISLNFKI